MPDVYKFVAFNVAILLDFYFDFIISSLIWLNSLTWVVLCTSDLLVENWPPGCNLQTKVGMSQSCVTYKRLSYLI